MDLRTDQVGEVDRLTLDFPPVNTVDLERVKALRAFFERRDQNRPLIVTGAGKAFSAGVDTKAFAAYDGTQRKALFTAITDMTAALVGMTAPVIAAINGHALGGGLILTLCADYRVAIDGDHRFGLTEAQAGVPFPEGPVEIMKHELPASVRRHLTLSSQPISARALHQHLIFDELVAADALADIAVERALALRAQPAFSEVKHQVRGDLQRRLAALRSSAAA